jgi:hypothetical protein
MAKESGAPMPLEGVRVLDVSQVMAGPFASMLLGDMGADVIKIEPSDGGDQTRRAMGFKLKGNDSLGFFNLNRNKRSFALNLKSDRARKVFYELVKTSDVLLENYRPGVTKRLGIDYETLSKINPRLIYASISGFGQTGPWSQRPGFDLIAQAMAGTMSITGHEGGPPTKCGVPVSDIVADRTREDGPRTICRRLSVRGRDGVQHLGHFGILGHGQSADAARHREPVQRAISGGARERHAFRDGREQQQAVPAALRSARPAGAVRRLAVFNRVGAAQEPHRAYRRAGEELCGEDRRRVGGCAARGGHSRGADLQHRAGIVERARQGA